MDGLLIPSALSFPCGRSWGDDDPPTIYYMHGVYIYILWYGMNVKETTIFEKNESLWIEKMFAK